MIIAFHSVPEGFFKTNPPYAENELFAQMGHFATNPFRSANLIESLKLKELGSSTGIGENRKPQD